MNILYLACMCDQKTYKEIYKEKKPIQAANKYHTLLCEGFVENGVAIKTICSIPINKDYSKKSYIKVTDKEQNHVMFSYLPVLTVPILKYLGLFISALIKSVHAKKDSILIYDGLIISAAMGALIGAKITRKKSVVILTDLPEYLGKDDKGVGKRLNNYLINKCDGYIFLTEQMNLKVNKTSKPYVVLEGHVDFRMSKVQKNWSGDDRRIVLYAGGLEKQYGLLELCNGFINICKPNEELHIYGDGGLREEIENFAKKYPNIIYGGVLPVQEVVEKELEATILVNPRSPDGEFTKYSFPSKTMEYMVTGTPVVMCNLPGMPREYTEYVFLFNDGKEKSIANKLRSVLDLSNEELEKFGEKAKKFVLENKTNIIQAKKIIDFIEYDIIDKY